jgi:hypothetical protein
MKLIFEFNERSIGEYSLKPVMLPLCSKSIGGQGQAPPYGVRNSRKRR